MSFHQPLHAPQGVDGISKPPIYIIIIKHMYRLLMTLGSLLVPIMFSIVIGFLSSTIWLVLLGELRLLALSVLLFAAYIIGVPLLIKPSALLSDKGATIIQTDKPLLGYIYSLFSSMYSGACIALLSFIAFKVLTMLAGPTTTTPAILMSYAVAYGPWLFMILRQKVEVGYATYFIVGFGAASHMIAASALLLFKVKLAFAACIFGGSMFAIVIAGTVLIILMAKSKHISV